MLQLFYIVFIVHKYLGLELGQVRITFRVNANYFSGKCESLCPTNSQFFLVTAYQCIGLLRITFANKSQK